MNHEVIVAHIIKGIRENQSFSEGGFAFFTGGIIANVLGNLTDPEWQDITKDTAKPCETPGCNCHKIRETVLSALEAFREDHKKHCFSIGQSSRLSPHRSN